LLLDEAEALLTVKEFDRALTGADDLGRHAAKTAAAAARPTRASATAAAKTISAAVATAKSVSAAVIPEIGRRGKSVHAAAKGIETVFADSVALVPPAPTSSIVTHSPVRILSHCPPSKAQDAGTVAAPNAGVSPE
jgi:hypothetical protein